MQTGALSRSSTGSEAPSFGDRWAGSAFPVDPEVADVMSEAQSERQLLEPSRGSQRRSCQLGTADACTHDEEQQRGPAGCIQRPDRAGFDAPSPSRIETKEDPMSEFINKAKGKIKQVGGILSGNEELKRDGERDEQKGQIEGAVKDVKHAVKSVVADAKKTLEVVTK